MANAPRRKKRKKKQLARKYVVRRALALTVLVMCGVIVLTRACSRGSVETASAGGAARGDGFITDPYTVYEYDRVVAETDALAARFPELIEKRVFGKSVEGRDLIALTLGKGDEQIVFTGAIHGNESFTTNFLMNLIERYALGYEKNDTYEGYSYRELLDKVSFLIVPMLNPDGVNISVNGPDAAADPAKIRAMDKTGTDYSFWKANANGVDLNRNLPYNWSEYNKTNHPALRYYVGPYAASEPETRAIMSLLEAEEFCMLADFHVYGEIIYWTDNISSHYYAAHRELAQLIMQQTGYGDAGIEDVDQFAGYLSNYARGVFGVFSITVELTPREKYPAAEFDAATERVYPIGLLMADYAVKHYAQAEPQAEAGGETPLETEAPPSEEA